MFFGREGKETIGNRTFAAISAAALLMLVIPYIPVLLNGGIIGIPLSDPSVATDSDAYHNVWHFWWVGKAVGEGDDPRICTAVYPPHGISLAFDHVGWWDTLTAALVGSEGFPAAAYNLSLFIGTLLTALFGWLLARSWGMDRSGALFTALALAWMPSRTAHLLQHYQLANMWAAVAALWLCSRYLKVRKTKYLVLYSAAVLVASFQSPFLALLVLLATAATLFVRDEWNSSLKLASAWALPAAGAALWLLTSPGSRSEAAVMWQEAVYWAPEPQSFLIISPFGPLSALLGMPMKMSWMSNVAEGVVTPGITVIVLMAVYVMKRRDWRLPAAVLFVWLLSLGPELRILGRPLGIPLPFRALRELPFMDGIRAPSRLAVAGTVMAVLGAGAALSRISTRWKYAILCVLALEMAVLRLHTLPDEVPEEMMSAGTEAVVTELPVDPAVRRYSWFQAACGYTRSYSFQARIPNIDEEELLEDRNDFKVYHRWLFTADERETLDALLVDVFPGASHMDSVWTEG
ncbi:MAG: hypothetical protein GF388_08215 [Candidatus Aegiribacteria sp.]|nr:hypothetical protein [Candidatus Aegiribacteria sp.]MBD3295070.1 hypothetical protein [Candidatus Fermentibacteria bacterium]